MRTIIIPADKFPSGRYTVELIEPLFKHRRVAFERHPGNQQTSYTVQELLLGSCIKSVNGTGVPETRDVLDNLTGLGHKDGQFLMAVFMSSFLIDEDDQQKAKDICLDFAKSDSPDVVILKSDMPTHSFDVSFRMPSFADRRRAQRLYPKSESDSGFSFEELFFASSLLSVGTEIVPASLKQTANGMISVLDEWSLLDVQFALTVFMTLTTLDNKEADGATDLGKSLRMTLCEPQKSEDLATIRSSRTSRTSSKPMEELSTES